MTVFSPHMTFPSHPQRQSYSEQRPGPGQGLQRHPQRSEVFQLHHGVHDAAEERPEGAERRHRVGFQPRLAC